MKLGMVGLGRMGSGMTERLRGDGHEVMTYDPQVESTASSLEELAQQLEAPRVVWMMIPAGEITEKTTRDLIGILDRDDVLVDGGNSNFHDSQRRNAEAAEQGVHFLDVGVSGGIWGLKEGFCLMAGGPDSAVARVQPALETLAPADGWAHVGPSGAGHFVKMVHNGIEYGLMQAYAEGLNVLKHANIGKHAQETDAETTPLRDPDLYKYDLDMAAITEVWRRGSVIASWLLDLTAEALNETPELDEYAGHVSDSGEGRWTVQAAVEEGVPTPVLAASLFNRFASRGEADFGDRVLSAMRKGFGGHLEKSPEQ
jgi:6-phosphogluconate dehydrogenase